MFHLPLEIALTIVFVFGSIIGSFLNVVIYRLHTGRSLNDRSHCLSCAKPLKWYELVPVLSYIALRSRCSGCGAWIPSRYVLVEILTGVLFVLLYLYTSDPLLLALYMILMSVLVVGLVYDLYHMIIPDEVVFATWGVALGIFAYQTYAVFSVSHAVFALGGAFFATLVYGGLWWYSQGKWIGFGDVKLAAPLGLLVGLGEVFSFIVFSFWIGAVVGILSMCVQYAYKRYTHPGVKKRAADYPNTTVANNPRWLTIKSEIPFAPFLIASFVAVAFLAQDVLTLMSYVTAVFF